jgi:hypothetical protein
MKLSLFDYLNAETGKNRSNPGKAQDKVPELVTFGDSVMWGEGLKPADKFREKLRQWLQVREMAMARCGATLLSKNPPTDQEIEEDIFNPGKATFDDHFLSKYAYSPLRFDRDVSHAHLTILRQVELVRDLLASADTLPLDIRQGKGIKYVLTTGGINDFDVVNFAFPDGKVLKSLGYPSIWAFFDRIIAASKGLGSHADPWAELITARFQEVGLREGITELAKALVTAFPRAKIVYCGYYPVISEETVAQHDVHDAFGALSLLGVLTTTGLAGDATAKSLQAFFEGIGRSLGERKEDIETHLFPALCRASLTFAHSINTAIRDAIQVADPSGTRMAVAIPEWQAKNSVFGSSSYLWGLKQTAGKSLVDSTIDLATRVVLGQPVSPAACPLEDDTWPDRFKACRRTPFPDPVSKVFSHMASFCHPNKSGADAYLTSVKQALKQLGVPIT